MNSYITSTESMLKKTKFCNPKHTHQENGILFLALTVPTPHLACTHPTNAQLSAAYSIKNNKLKLQKNPHTNLLLGNQHDKITIAKLSIAFFTLIQNEMHAY